MAAGKFTTTPSPIEVVEKVNAVIDDVAGKLSTSGTAAKATADASGNNIANTYATKATAITGLSVSGTTITYTKGNGTTGTITTQDTDTKYTHPNSGATAGTYRSVTVNAQGHVTAGTNPTITVGQGGTGATDAATARSNLGVTLSNLGAAPAYTYSTTDLTAGSSNLTTGKLYIVYE